MKGSHQVFRLVFLGRKNYEVSRKWRRARAARGNQANDELRETSLYFRWNFNPQAGVAGSPRGSRLREEGTRNGRKGSKKATRRAKKVKREKPLLSQHPGIKE